MTFEPMPVFWLLLTLGAYLFSRWLYRRTGRYVLSPLILVPALLPAWLTGFALAFARGVGEYGSVIFIAGNMPMKTEILPLLIMVKLDQYDYRGATSIGVLMLVVSFVLLLLINLLQRRIERP